MTGRSRCLRLALLAGSALSAAPVAAGELPTGGSVVNGAVGVATPGQGRMVITQTSPDAVVNWRSFGIGAGARVDIDQPSAGAAILNRVTGSTLFTTPPLIGTADLSMDLISVGFKIDLSEPFPPATALK